MVSEPFDGSAEELDRLLRVFYRKIFPCELFCRWLSYGTKNSADTLSRREFSFSLAGDVYVRYQSFNDAPSLRKELVKSCPHKIDIGAVYSASPRLQRSLSSTSFKPEWKELVFDIDLTDYDDIRFCCGSQNTNASSAICQKCWQLAKCAVLCLDRALREDFGFEHLLWVFSGRRGVHCWVCDPVARQLDSTSRTAVAEYLSLVNSSEGRKNKFAPASKEGVLLEPLLHPSIDAAFEILKVRAAEFISSQELLSHPGRIKWLLKFLPPDMATQRESLEEMWSKEDVCPSEAVETSMKRWNTLQRFLIEQRRLNVLKQIVVNTMYPRLDVHVTTGMNHLLKSPFCAHPKTGFICVPFDPRHIDEFDPRFAPRLSDLVAELSRLFADAGECASERHLLAYKQTSLRPAIELLEHFVNRLVPPSPPHVAVEAPERSIGKPSTSQTVMA